MSSLSYPDWPTKADLSGRPVAGVLSQMSNLECSVLAVPPLLIHRDCPVLVSCAVFAVIFLPSWSLFPVPAFMTHLPCPGCPVSTVLRQDSRAQRSCPAVLSLLSCLVVLSGWLSWPTWPSCFAQVMSQILPIPTVLSFVRPRYVPSLLSYPRCQPSCPHCHVLPILSFLPWHGCTSVLFGCPVPTVLSRLIAYPLLSTS